MQEATPSGAVASWRAYSASGALSAGSDAAERPFFGYNGEMQDAATGLVYMRARHYDAASGRFGSADSVLGSLAGPLSLNRYLYCGADPVNFVDPTGHARVVSYKPKGRPKKSTFPGFDPAAQSGRANIDPVVRDFVQMEVSVAMRNNWTSARKDAWNNTTKWTNERAGLIESKYGYAAREAFSAAIAARYKKQMERIYCGSSEHLKDFAGGMHALAQDYWYVPVAGTLVDWCAYVAEGNVEMTALYSVLSLVDVLGVSSVGSLKTGLAAAIKSGGKLVMGSGVKAVSKLYKPIEKVSDNTLHHIFDNPNHNLDALLRKYGGDKEKAYRAIEDRTIVYASINSDFYSSPNAVAHINVDGIELEVRYALVDGTVRIPTAYVPEGA